MQEPERRLYPSTKIVVLLTALVAVCSGSLYIIGNKLIVPLLSLHPSLLKFVFDTTDMDVYYNSAAWVFDGGRLYREVPSEYPLFANTIFATVRILGNVVHPGRYGFYAVWMVLAAGTYLAAVIAVIARTRTLSALAWIAPATIYFALYRFDIYPAAATLIALFSARRTAYFQAAFWFGVAIALKGYTLFLLPAYCVFVGYQRGFAALIKVAVLALIPIFIGLIAAFAFSGWEGMLSPFRFHAARNLNYSSTYDAINYLLGQSMFSDMSAAGFIAPGLQIGCALAAAATRPRTFHQVVDASLFAVLGFMSFSVFYSPQFVLWILPLTCFSDSLIILIAAIAFFSWLTYFYYPVTWWRTLILGWNAFRTSVIAVTLFRFFMMVFAAGSLFRSRKYTGRKLAVPKSYLSV